MKGSDFLIFVVVIGIVAGLVSLGITEFNNMPVGEDITPNNYTDYQQVEGINNRVNSTMESFRTLGDDEASWFSKVSAGIVAIPKVVIGFPILILYGVGLLFTMVTTSLTGKVPIFVVFGLLTLLMIVVVRRFMEFFQRARA
jgi:hypothetical protein